MVKSVHENDPDIEPGEDLSEQEQELRVFLGQNAGQLDVFHAGLRMEEFKDSPAGTSLIKEATDDIEEAFNAFIEADDLDTEKVKAAHFKARIAIGIIGRVQDVILHGKEAGDSIEEMQTAD